MKVTLLGKVMLVRDVHLEKADVPIEVRPSGMMTELSKVH